MKYQVNYNQEYQIIEIKIEGDFWPEQIGMMSPDISEIAERERCARLLYDFQDAILSFSTLDIYKIPKRLEKITQDTNVRVTTIKRAFLFAEGKDDSKFFETVALNSMHNVKCFKDREEAHQWLTSTDFIPVALPETVIRQSN